MNGVNEPFNERMGGRMSGVSDSGDDERHDVKGSL